MLNWEEQLKLNLFLGFDTLHVSEVCSLHSHFKIAFLCLILAIKSLSYVTVELDKFLHQGCGDYGSNILFPDCCYN